jgi:DNA-directed RNA polymerase specialized sigma24 family protein
MTPERDVLKENLKRKNKKITLRIMREGYEIFWTYIFRRVKVKEIAKAMNTSIKAVELKLVRARREFKENWLR